MLSTASRALVGGAAAGGSPGWLRNSVAQARPGSGDPSNNQYIRRLRVEPCSLFSTSLSEPGPGPSIGIMMYYWSA
jgi:hypothetical protein